MREEQNKRDKARKDKEKMEKKNKVWTLFFNIL
jgi:hypothetical protein